MNRRSIFAAVAGLGATVALGWAAAQPIGYEVVVAKSTAADPAWKEVVAALVAKHHATVVPSGIIMGRD